MDPWNYLGTKKKLCQICCTKGKHHIILYKVILQGTLSDIIAFKIWKGVSSYRLDPGKH